MKNRLAEAKRVKTSLSQDWRRVSYALTLGLGSKSWGKEFDDAEETLGRTSSLLRTILSKVPENKKKFEVLVTSLANEVALIQFQNSLLVKDADALSNIRVIDSDYSKNNHSFYLRIKYANEVYAVQVAFDKDEKGQMHSFAFIKAQQDEIEKSPAKYRIFRPNSILYAIAGNAGRRVYTTAVIPYKYTKSLSALGIKITPDQEFRLRLRGLSSPKKLQEVSSILKIAEMKKFKGTLTEQQTDLLNSYYYYSAYGPSMMPYMPMQYWMFISLTDSDTARCRKVEAALTQVTADFQSGKIPVAEIEKNFWVQLQNLYPQTVTLETYLRSDSDFRTFVTFDQRNGLNETGEFKFGVQLDNYDGSAASQRALENFADTLAQYDLQSPTLEQTVNTYLNDNSFGISESDFRTATPVVESPGSYSTVGNDYSSRSSDSGGGGYSDSGGGSSDSGGGGGGGGE